MVRPWHCGCLVVLCACGASLRGLYESDVRFEHCMALDSRPDVKPTLRRACWEEWLSFYTFEQTRDRIDHAMLRERQLGAASDFDEGSVAPVRVAAATPDPTSAIAPPPMLMLVVVTDAGAPDAAAADTEADQRAAALARCAAECQEGHDACRQTCKATPACERACGARQKRCAARCAQRAQGSR
jgi:hypothetical protein